MTRFARRNIDGRQGRHQVSEATPWSELKKRQTGPKSASFKNQRREDRRMKRIEDRKSQKVCFNCRKVGHMLSDCPIFTETNHNGICFKCGSTEHAASACKVKVPKDSYPYAKCFVCKEKGHISKQCPDNPRGIYPKGGSCKECGSVEHFKRDCPEFLEKKAPREEVFADVFEEGTSMDADPSTSDLISEDQPVAKKKKVVKF